VNGTDDLIKLQVNLGDCPPAAGAELTARHGLQGRPGDFGEHLSIIGTAAFVHGLIKRQKTKRIKEHRQRLAVRGTKYDTPGRTPETVTFQKLTKFVLFAEGKTCRERITPKGWKKFRTKSGYFADLLRTPRLSPAKKRTKSGRHDRR
jgi:hypothetical protein